MPHESKTNGFPYMSGEGKRARREGARFWSSDHRSPRLLSADGRHPLGRSHSPSCGHDRQLGLSATSASSAWLWQTGLEQVSVLQDIWDAFLILSSAVSICSCEARLHPPIHYHSLFCPQEPSSITVYASVTLPESWHHRPRVGTGGRSTEEPKESLNLAPGLKFSPYSTHQHSLDQLQGDVASTPTNDRNKKGKFPAHLVCSVGHRPRTVSISAVQQAEWTMQTHESRPSVSCPSRGVEKESLRQKASAESS